MTSEDIKKRLINNDALFNNIYVIEQTFDILPNDHPHFGAAISYQDISELRNDFLNHLVDTVVDWVYSSEKYNDLKRQFIATGKSEAAAVSQIIRKAAKKFRRGEDTLLIQGQLGELLLIIRNPHLYTRHHHDEAELTSYEMANLRGRAGRLLKDFVGRTIVLDESEFEETEGYDQQTLFVDVGKDVYTGYGERFGEFRDQIIATVSADKLVDRSMSGYGYLVTYIRQAVLRYGKGAKQRMAETGVTLTSKQVAAIILKLKTLSIPKEICLRNRYWDPFVLNDIFLKFKGKVPNIPIERGARNRLSEILKFLRDNESTAEMYERYVPAQYRERQKRGLLCSMCIKWSSEKPLSEFLSGDYYTGENASEKIEKTIRLLQDTISFSIPLLIKPIIEIRNEKSAMVTCLQAGAYKRSTRKMIEIGVPRELAINLNSLLFPTEISDDISAYDFELLVRGKIQEALPTLPYWEQVQLDFLKANK